jgi:hypothetical protein
MRIDVTGAFLGLSASDADLYSRIGDMGWSIKSIKFDKKKNLFVAIAKNPHGEECEKTGNDHKVALSNLLLAVTRRSNMRTTAQNRISMWTHLFTDQLKPIAEAYVKAPVYDPKGAIAFKELADDATHRAKVLADHLKIEVVNNPEPYTDAEKMADDIHKRRRILVSRAMTDHPVWTEEQIISFRICFDVLGYAVAGASWDWRGDNLAFAAYAPLISANAQEALFTEVIAQSAYVNQYRAYGPRKIALFPTFLKPAQDAEGVGPFTRGLHPSQSFPPVAAPAFKPLKFDKDAPYPLPHHRPVGLKPFSSINPELADPNSVWTSGAEPLQPNAYLDHGDPLEYAKSMDTAQLIDTEWAEFKTGDNLPDYERMKLAIVNAFRAVLLSPRKELKWNATQYQDISHVPPSASDPAIYWHALDKKRMDWNVKHFGEAHRYSHRIYWKFVKPLENIVFKLNPTAGYEAAKERANQMVEDWITEEQNRIMREDQERPPEKQLSSDAVERKSYDALAKRMKQYIQESRKDTDVRMAASATQEPLEGEEWNETENPAPERYAGFMGAHLKAIAQVSQHVDEILKAALEDVHEHDGAGHHFRAAVMQIGIGGVGQKVASFAWLLLQPMTSQLATIDTHIMDMLGHKYEKDMTTRDYGKFERELAAGRDAAGYGHMPLGAFQWSIWDNRRTGEGSHQDHSAFRVEDPLPFDQVKWEPPVNPNGHDHLDQEIPDWWQATLPIREQVGQEWDERQGKDTPKTRIPFQRVNQEVFAKISARVLTPWFLHPATGEQMAGQPGSTLMTHAVNTLHLTTPEIWAMVPDGSCGKS